MSSEEAVDSTLLVEPSDETEPSEETEAERAGRLAPLLLPAQSSSSSGSSIVCGCGGALTRSALSTAAVRASAVTAPRSEGSGGSGALRCRPRAPGPPRGGEASPA